MRAKEIVRLQHLSKKKALNDRHLGTIVDIIWCDVIWYERIDMISEDIIYDRPSQPKSAEPNFGNDSKQEAAQFNTITSLWWRNLPVGDIQS